jgi:hypothetical protein
VFTGTGTAGAYHAGVLRAVQEAGVKIDIVAGRGVGVAGAMFSAIDGGEHLWGARRGWETPGVTGFYPWRRTLRTAAATLAVALGALVVPLAVLVGAVIVFPAGFLLQLVGLEAGVALASGYTRLVETVFHPSALPVFLPRFITVMLLSMLVTLAVSAGMVAVRSRLHRRFRGALWWELLGAPLSTTRIADWFMEGLWQIMRGATRIARPASSDLGERYAQLLADNVGQPGFRELIVLVHDLDGRRDLVAALLAEPYRRPFFLRRLGEDSGERHLETMDLAGPARQHATDLLTASLSVPIATQPHLMAFSTDSVWRGETHRLCDRPESTARLLEEVAHAGAEQVILVTSLSEPHGPHMMGSGRRDGRGRAGEVLAAVESASVRDALTLRSGLFQSVFQIRPTHNPLGPFDFAGCYDEHSDRRYTTGELVARGYEDGFRQFVDSVVGASGEFIDSAHPARPGVGSEARATSSGESY